MPLCDSRTINLVEVLTIWEISERKYRWMFGWRLVGTIHNWAITELFIPGFARHETIQAVLERDRLRRWEFFRNRISVRPRYYRPGLLRFGGILQTHNPLENTLLIHHRYYLSVVLFFGFKRRLFNVSDNHLTGVGKVNSGISARLSARSICHTKRSYRIELIPLYALIDK